MIFVLYSDGDVLSDKSETNQDKASFLSTSLLLPTSIVILLLVLLCLSTVTTSISDSKLNQPTTQSTLSSIQLGNLKFEDRYETFRPYFTTVLCKNLRWSLQLAGYNRWKHRWIHTQHEHEHEHKISFPELNLSRLLHKYYGNHNGKCINSMQKPYGSYSNKNPIEATDYDTSRLSLFDIASFLNCVKETIINKTVNITTLQKNFWY